MNKGRIMLFAMLAAITIVIAVFASFVVSSRADLNAPSIELPAEVSSGFEPGAVGDIFDSAPPASEITPKNLSDLVLSLDRPDDYYETLTVELFWDGGSAKMQREVWSSGGLQLIKSYTDAGERDYNYIVAGEKTYIWREGDAQYYIGATGEFGADNAAQIPTYEDLAEIGSSNVVNCGYEASGDTPCLYAETTDEFGQSHRWWVELSSGLLWKYETWDEGELAYRMQAMSLSTDAVDRGQFILPDGNSAFDLR